MAAVWAIWAWLFFRYFRSASDGYTAFTRVFRGLVGGTVLELLVAGPVHALHTDHDQCYCARELHGTRLWLHGGGVAVRTGGVSIVFTRESTAWDSSRCAAELGRDYCSTRFIPASV